MKIRLEYPLAAILIAAVLAYANYASEPHPVFTITAPCGPGDLVYVYGRRNRESVDAVVTKAIWYADRGWILHCRYEQEEQVRYIEVHMKDVYIYEPDELGANQCPCFEMCSCCHG
jgi:hypothetical protein